MKKAFQNLLLIFFGFLAAFLVAEIYTRLTEFKSVLPTECRVEDKIIHHKLKPNSNCKYVTKEWDIDYRINSLGLRDKEISKVKPKGFYRILVLGDSFVEGQGVNLEDTFVKGLEKLLADKYRNIQVLNGGVISYSPILEYLYLKNFGLELKPDLVIVNFDLTDFQNELEYEKNTIYDKEGKPIAVDSERRVETPTQREEDKKIPDVTIPFLPLFIKQFLHDNSKFYLFATIKIKGLLGKAVPGYTKGDIREDTFALTREEKPKDYEKAFVLPEKHLLLIKQLLKKENIPFILTAQPSANQVSGKEWATGRLFHGFRIGKIYPSRHLDDLKNFAEKEDIRFISFLKDFRESRQYPLFFPEDGHLTQNGHQLIAEELLKFLIDSSYISNNFLR